MSCPEFKELIQRDSDICNNCFRRTHDTFERNYAVDTCRNGGETKLWARHIEAPDRSWRREHKTDYIPAEPASHGTYVACECGTDSMRPVSMTRAMDFVDRIAERLDEKGVGFDREVLVSETRYLMQQPENQGKQDESVFGRAAEKAIAHDV